MSNNENLRKKEQKQDKISENTNTFMDLGSLNLYQQFIFWLKNAPHWLLIMISPYLGYWTFIGSCCCVNTAEGITMRNQGLSYFTNSDNLFYIICVLLPFLLGVILGSKMLYQMIFNINYPNGDSPYGFFPLLALAGFIGTSYFYLASLGLFC